MQPKLNCDPLLNQLLNHVRNSLNNSWDIQMKKVLRILDR